MTDNINHPKHYRQFSHEVIELTARLDFATGNVVKYILRSPFKGRELEDLDKAAWYLDWLMRHPRLRGYRGDTGALFRIFADDLCDIGRQDLAEVLDAVRLNRLKLAMLKLYAAYKMRKESNGSKSDMEAGA